MAIAVGLRVATTTTVSGVEEAAISALAKLHQVLPTRLRAQVAAIGAHTTQLPQGDLPTVDGEVLVTLAAGCRDVEGIRFRYRTHDGTESERTVEPLQIVHTGRRWYLVARDRDRQAWRTFRVDRIAAPCSPARATTSTTRPIRSHSLPKAPEWLPGTSSPGSASTRMRPR